MSCYLEAGRIHAEDAAEDKQAEVVVVLAGPRESPVVVEGSNIVLAYFQTHPIAPVAMDELVGEAAVAVVVAMAEVAAVAYVKVRYSAIAAGRKILLQNKILINFIFGIIERVENHL